MADLLEWEDGSDGSQFTSINGVTVIVRPSADGGYCAGVWQIIGGGVESSEDMKELVQAWADRHPAAIKPLPFVLDARGP
jgi:8-oxo-dGTP pyrophosphatase MutT (NUDIX family)